VVAKDCSDTEVAGWTKSYISVIAYVDDIVYASPHIAGIIAFESAIVKRFNAKLLGDWKWFLGLNIVHDRDLKQPPEGVAHRGPNAKVPVSAGPYARPW
jgi:hypothetical protein